MTFRRYVRTAGLEFSPDVPADMVEQSLRTQLTIEQRHSIIESTWRTGELDDFASPRPRRWMRVRYVTGGQRHGLVASLDWERAPGVVEFPGRT